MAAIKVHGVPRSATMRVLATLYEKELEFEFVPVDLSTGAHKNEPLITLNPFGQVPVFEDGDLKLFESRAITKYIVHEYAGKGTQLIFQDSKKNAILGVWMEVEAHQFEPIAYKLAWELAYKQIYSMTPDEGVVEENETKLGKVLDIYEVRLGESKYLAGDCFTLADLHHLPAIQSLLGTKVKVLFDSRPNVWAWVTDITSRAAWSKSLSHAQQLKGRYCHLSSLVSTDMFLRFQ